MNAIRLLLLLAWNAPSAAPPVTITVRPAPEVVEQSFTLGEIAEVACTDKNLAARISRIGGWASPFRGLQRTLYRSDIVARLRGAGLDMARIELNCPDRFAIARGGLLVPESDLVKAATDAVMEARRKEAGASPEEEGVELVRPPVRAFVQPGKLAYRTPDVRTASSGILTLPVTVLVDGKPAASINVTLRIKRLVKAVVAARLIEAKAVISAEDLMVANVEPVSGQPAPNANPALLIGKRASHRIAQGAPVTLSHVEAALALAAGAQVAVEMAAGAVRITASGVARGAGAPGDKIKVYLPDTRKEVTATVVDARTVRLEEMP